VFEFAHASSNKFKRGVRVGLPKGLELPLSHLVVRNKKCSI
jgi:hypothetical protein